MVFAISKIKLNRLKVKCGNPGLQKCDNPVFIKIGNVSFFINLNFFVAADLVSFGERGLFLEPTLFDLTFVLLEVLRIEEILLLSGFLLVGFFGLFRGLFFLLDGLSKVLGGVRIT